eukprot:CAMPEP_0113854226 /NCGR_PEP_ID=MMETSP0372-20130328/7149_1 /TAXON_ID=340204 /ORGANISM="Lankesteria abbotti" /LENGTH=251 /DNA_ID=CAMNT_0000827265 /DNA_START=45 /DNA_END=797 /DNA_ORIENTATION=+ /assembly_acc=CAM_ASM_000359
MMEQANFSVKQKLTDPEFLSVFVRVLRRTNINQAVKEDILSLVESWSNTLARDSDLFPTLATLRNQLTSHGFNVSAPMANIYDDTYRRGVDKTLDDRIATIRDTVAKAQTMLSSTQSDPSKNPKLAHIVAMLSRDSNRIQKLIGSESSGDVMFTLIQTNDLVLQILQEYQQKVHAARNPPPPVPQSGGESHLTGRRRSSQRSATSSQTESRLPSSSATMSSASASSSSSSSASGSSSSSSALSLQSRPSNR